MFLSFWKLIRVLSWSLKGWFRTIISYYSIVEWGLILILPILINVAFLTLLERKLLRFRQIRVGPIKVGGFGLLQPFADVVKLFINSFTLISIVVSSRFLMAPSLALILALILPLVLPLRGSRIRWEFSFLLLLTILSLNIYPLLLSGWASRRKYAFIGGLRGVAQTISYEIRLAFLVMSLFVLSCVRRFSREELGVNYISFYPLMGLWAVSCVAELNRTPFDFSEGESELVSGFNIEYGSVKFALIFMAEYAIILTLRLLRAVLLLGVKFLRVKVVIAGLILRRVVIWLRATLPRYRYDLLMNLAWKTLLPWRIGITQVVRGLALWLI